MKIRDFQVSDRDAAVSVFHSAVHALAASRYTREQRDAWAPHPPDSEYWQRRLAEPRVRVAEEHGHVIGFIAFNDDGHIDLLFTAPAYARRGVATALYRDAETILARRGVSVVFTEASAVARPFFERMGFDVVNEETVTRSGVALHRYRMRKISG